MATASRDIVLDVYARVSRLGDDRQRSTTGQVDDCTTRIAERGAEVGQVHIDSGRSAWNPRVRRPGWDTLMERLESGVTGGVVVFDLARFSRRPIEGERLIAAAEQGLLVLDSEGEYDLMSASGKKAFRDQLAAAAYESDRLSTRVTRGKRIKAMRGESNHSSRPYGFEMDGTTIRESEASIVRDLAARLLAGESQDAMIVELNANGVVTSYGKEWTRAGLRQVLTRPRNAGLIEYRGQVVSKLEPTSGPLCSQEVRCLHWSCDRIRIRTILNQDIHDRICALYASRRPGRPISDAYLCSGTVHCGRCQHPLSGRPRMNMKPYPDGSPKRQYWCQPRSHNGGCGRIAVDQRELDRHVGILVVRILSDPRHAAAVEAAAAAVSKQIEHLDAEIADAEHLADQLADRLGRGEMTLARYDRAAAPLERRLEELRRQRAELDVEPAAIVRPEVIAASQAEWTRRWEDAEVPERRALLRQALRGRKLLVMPADPTAPRRFDPKRIALSE